MYACVCLCVWCVFLHIQISDMVYLHTVAWIVTEILSAHIDPPTLEVLFSFFSCARKEEEGHLDQNA